jgi:hypothetical protein
VDALSRTQRLQVVAMASSQIDIGVCVRVLSVTCLCTGIMVWQKAALRTNEDKRIHHLISRTSIVKLRVPPGGIPHAGNPPAPYLIGERSVCVCVCVCACLRPRSNVSAVRNCKHTACTSLRITVVQTSPRAGHVEEQSRLIKGIVSMGGLTLRVYV